MCILLLLLNIQTSVPDTQSPNTKRIELGLNDPSIQDYYLVDTGRRMTIIILVFLNNNPDYSKKILKSNVQIGCDLIFNIIMSNYFDNIAWYNLKAKTLNNPDTCSLIKNECVNNMEEYYRLYVLGGEQDRISCMVEYITSEICTKLDENEIVSDFRNYVRRSSSHFVFKLMREYNGNEIEYVYVAKPSVEDSCTGMEKSIDEAYVVTNYTDLHNYLQELSDEGSRTKVFLENNFLYIFISKIVIQVCKVQSDKKTRLISPAMFKNLLLSETKTFLCDILQKQFYNSKNIQPIHNFDILFCFRMREEDMCMLLNLVRNYKMPESDKMMIGELLSQAISFTTRILIYSHCKFFVPELNCCDTLIERLSSLEWHNIDSFVAYFDVEFCNKKDMKAKLCRSNVCLGEEDDCGKFDATKMQLTMINTIGPSLIF